MTKRSTPMKRVVSPELVKQAIIKAAISAASGGWNRAISLEPTYGRNARPRVASINAQKIIESSTLLPKMLSRSQITRYIDNELCGDDKWGAIRRSRFHHTPVHWEVTLAHADVEPLVRAWNRRYDQVVDSPEERRELRQAMRLEAGQSSAGVIRCPSRRNGRGASPAIVYRVR